jgi:hypothetical protein
MYIFKFLSHLWNRYPGKSVILESCHISTHDFIFRVGVVDLSNVTVWNKTNVWHWHQIATYFTAFNTVVLVCKTYYLLNKGLDLSLSTYMLCTQL